MPIGALIGGGLGLLGSSMASSSASRAAETSAAAQLEAARIAAQEARFRPVGITSRFGSSNFQFGIPGVSAPTLSQFKTREQQLAEAATGQRQIGLLGGGVFDSNYGGMYGGPTRTLNQFRTPEEQLATATAEYQARLANEGRLTGAGYELSPDLRAQQDRLMALSEQGLTDAEGAAARYAPLRTAGQSLFDLGSQYLAQSPEDVAANYMAQQMNLLAPSRERQYAQLQNQLYQTGRGGLAIGATGARPDGTAGLSAANPEMEAYYNALAQQDAQLAAQAQQAGQQQLAFGAGLFGQGSNLLGGYESGVVGALNPYTSMLGAASTLESLGQQPLDIGAQLGGRAATAGGNVGQFLLAGGQNAALTRQAANQQNPLAAALIGFGNSPAFQGMASGAGDWVSSLFGNSSPYNQTQLRNEDASGMNSSSSFFNVNPQARSQGYGYF
jgi:hypothetical protein